MYYISRFDPSETGKKNILQNIVLKKKYGDITYISSIGYGGGGVFEEFCGKFFWDEEEEVLVGYFTSQHDPDEWETKTFEDEEVDQPYESISEDDRDIISQMTQEIWNNFIIFDENTETRLIKDEIVNELDNDLTHSDDWDVDVVDFVSNNFWGLTLRFDW